MKSYITAAAIVIAALSSAADYPSVLSPKTLVADGGRSYSGRAAPSGSAAGKSSSTTPSQPAQPKPADDPVGAAVKAGSDLFGKFGR